MEEPLLGGWTDHLIATAKTITKQPIVHIFIVFFPLISFELIFLAN